MTMSSSSSSSRRMGLRKSPRQTKSKQRNAGADTPIPLMPLKSHSSSAITHIKKPMRPLTAYHIFFQIEREYIIQTCDGPVAENLIHEEKYCLPNVPRRYECTRLPPDWYFGPGKRKKRKHRKSHGKIGFLELSHAISKRWATLDRTDPETKRYVAGVAARELDDYRREVKEYKRLTTGTVDSNPCNVTALSAAAVGAMISPSVSPKPEATYHPTDVPSSSLLPHFQEPMQLTLTEMPESVLSLEHDFAVDEEGIGYSICSVSNDGHCIPYPNQTLSSDESNVIDEKMPETVLSLDPEQDYAVCEKEIDYCICSVSNGRHCIPSPSRTLISDESNVIDEKIPETVLSLDPEQDFAVGEDEIDYSICSVSNNGHYIPSPGPALSSGNIIDGTICDPLFEYDQEPMSKRCVSPR